MPIGDYRIQSGTYSPPIVIERKNSLDEVIGNLLDKDKDNEGNNRFMRELIRASKTVPKTRIILLIEDKDYYEKLLKGDYRSEVHPNAIRGMIMSLEAKYPNLSIVFTYHLVNIKLKLNLLNHLHFLCKTLRLC